MAGRPASVRGGGLTGLHYGLITFVVLTVASLGGFIFQLTRVKEADQRAASAERRLTRFGSPGGALGAYYENEATARETGVFQVVLDAHGRLGRLVAGMQDAVAPALETKAHELLAQIAGAKPGVVSPDDPLMTAIRKLDERLTQEINEHRRTADNLAEKERLVQQQIEQLKAARDTFEQQVAQLETQARQAREEGERRLSDKDAQVGELTRTLEAREQQMNQLRREWETERREFQLENTRKERQVAELQKTIQAVKGSFDPEAILKKADGRVLRAIPGSDVVYVNLGSENHIKVGMPFVVFSQAETADRELRGKAALEVTHVMESSAECRVTRSRPGQPIMEGDIVVNIAYEQGRKPKFVVRGDFDLNYDGQIDFDGLERVADIIRQWGGQVTPELDESVDFVVIGVAPLTAEIGPNDSDIVRYQKERRLLERTQFQRLIEQARGMFIPVITQNQFLFLTGYVGDGVAR